MSGTDLETEMTRSYGNVDAVKRDGLIPELEHARFRDSDLSVKGTGILGFAGLMLACNFVFLSADPTSFLAPAKKWDAIGLVAALVLTVGAFCALRSILTSDPHKGSVSESAGVSRGFLLAVVRFHRRRRFWLNAGGVLTMVGTLTYLVAILASVTARY